MIAGRAFGVGFGRLSAISNLNTIRWRRYCKTRPAMRRSLAAVAALAITGLSACSARQPGGTALIAGVTNRPATAERSPVPGSVQHLKREGNASARDDLPRAARTARQRSRHERGAEVAGTSGRLDANTSAEIAPVSTSAGPVSDSPAEKPAPVETQLRQSHHRPTSFFLRPVGIILLIVTAVVVTRRFF